MSHDAAHTEELLAALFEDAGERDALADRVTACEGCLEHAASLLTDLPVLAQAAGLSSEQLDAALERLESALLDERVAAPPAALETTSESNVVDLQERRRGRSLKTEALALLGAAAAAVLIVVVARPPDVVKTKDLDLERVVSLEVRELSGSLTEAQLRAGLETRSEAVTACATDEPVEVTLVLDIRGDGIANPARVVGRATPVTECVVEALRPASFDLARSPTRAIVRLLMTASPRGESP
jgi:hypothetical protein